MKKSDFDLLNQLHLAVKAERKITLQVLELLKEVEFRKLYLTLSYGSLLEFCMKELRYSESAAYRRISAMCALCDVPVLEKKIEDGSLSLAVISQAQTHIRQKEKRASVKMNTKEKASLFESLSGLSCREAEKELIRKDPETFEISLKKESVRQITKDLQELKIMLDPEMQADLEILKNLLSHTIPGASIKDILKFAVKESIQKRDLQREVKARKREAAPAPVLNKNETPANAEPSAGDMAEKKNVNSANQNPSGAVEIKSSSQISVGMRTPLAVAEKRLVWRKSQGQCCYRHEGRRCSSRFQLQIDHIIPLARDGTNEISNLQLLCRQHNQMKGFHLQK